MTQTAAARSEPTHSEGNTGGQKAKVRSEQEKVKELKEPGELIADWERVIRRDGEKKVDWNKKGARGGGVWKWR